MALRGNPLVRFLIFGVVLYVGWYSFYEFVIRRHTGLDAHVIHYIVLHAEWGLRTLGYTLTSSADPALLNLIAIEGSAGVTVGAPCDGIALFGLFTVFIIAYPGPLKRKLWFIPSGIAIIHAANVIRVVALAIIMSVNPEWLSFNHDYTFTIFVYAVVFGLWYLWVERLAPTLRPTAA